MSAHHPDFAREILTIGDACAGVLSRLYEVVQAQQRSVLDLASSGDGHRGAPGSKERVAALMSALSTGAAAPANAAQVTAVPASATLASEASAPSAKGEGGEEAKASAEGAEAAPSATPEEILKLGIEASHALADAAPYVALAGLQQAVVHAIGLATYNVVTQQQNLAVLAQAIITAEASGHAGARRSAGDAGDAARSAGDAGPRAAAR